MQIQQTAIQSQRALNVSMQQTSVKDRERRILQLTIDEISQMKGDINLYKGVGKMYDTANHLQDVNSFVIYLGLSTFLAT